MKFWQKVGAAAVVAGAAALLAPQAAVAQGAIKMDGSSTVFPIAEAVAEEYQICQARQGPRDGRHRRHRRWLQEVLPRRDGHVERVASDPKEEMELCRKAGIKYVEMPVAYDALTVVVNPKNDWVKSMTVADLKKMWEPAAQGRIMNWKQVRSEYPDEKLMLFGPGADSGTFDYFTEAVMGRSKSSRVTSRRAKTTTRWCRASRTTRTALGYFGFAYYVAHQDKMRAVPIDGGGGPVSPSLEAVIDGSYTPLSRPLFVYVKESSMDRPEVREFVQFMLTKGGTW